MLCVTVLKMDFVCFCAQEVFYYILFVPVIKRDFIICFVLLCSRWILLYVLCCFAHEGF